jgi:hypothetical protein
LTQPFAHDIFFFFNPQKIHQFTRFGEFTVNEVFPSVWPKSVQEIRLPE